MTIRNKYESEGLLAAAKEVSVQGLNLVKENKWKTAFFAIGVPSIIFTAMHIKAGLITSAEAPVFFATTFSYFAGTNQAIAASLPGFIGTGIAGQVVAGAIMAIAAAAVLYGTYKVGSYLTGVVVDACKGKSADQSV